ncbi:MAG: RnfH family protein [Gammaproteobacteria bacterium]
MGDQVIRVEVAYASTAQQCIIPLQVPVGCQVQQAIMRSKIIQQFPEIDLNSSIVGIFSQPTSLNAVLKEGDRIEIYRALMVDPKHRRRMRASCSQ